jgi:hypothetical protein
MKSTGAGVPGLQLEALLRDMYPHTRKGMKTGDTWTDTTTASNKIGNGEMNVRAVTTYKAGASETVAGMKATRLAAIVASQIAGTQATPGGSADIEGTGNGTWNYLVGPNNEFLGGDGTSTSNLSVTILGAQAATLPVTLKQSVDIRVLR